MSMGDGGLYEKSAGDAGINFGFLQRVLTREAERGKYEEDTDY